MRIGRGSEAVEKWGIYEIALEGPRDGNPFADVSLYVDFRFMNRVVTCRGFYDGDGVYRARLMPDAEGIWEYSTRSSVGSLNGHTGSSRKRTRTATCARSTMATSSTITAGSGLLT